MNDGDCVLKENYSKMIFIQGHWCHIKHIFAKDLRLDLLFLICLPVWIWATYALHSYKAFIRPEMISNV